MRAALAEDAAGTASEGTPPQDDIPPPGEDDIPFITSARDLPPIAKVLR
jgi:hypothetical protein